MPPKKTSRKITGDFEFVQSGRISKSKILKGQVGKQKAARAMSDMTGNENDCGRPWRTSNSPPGVSGSKFDIPTDSLEITVPTSAPSSEQIQKAQDNFQARKDATPGRMPAVLSANIEKGMSVSRQIRSHQSLSKKPSFASTESYILSPTVPHLTAAEKKELGIGAKIEREDHALPSDPEFAHWAQAERDLFNQFADRGAEPLLPMSWKLDFPTMPDTLFTENEDEAFIRNHAGKQFQAVKALDSLLLAGTRVRDRLLASEDPSSVLQRAIAAYYKWCLADGQLENKDIRPIFVSVATHRGESTGEVVSRTTSEFRTMSNEYRSRIPNFSKNRKNAKITPGNSGLPTLYGVIIAKSVLAVVTYDTTDPNAILKTIALFDFADDEQDVWNTFAVAILLVTVRNFLISLDEKDLPKKELDDPDA